MENNTQLISDLTALDRKEGEMWFSLLIMICFFTFVGILIFGIKKVIELMSKKQIAVVRNATDSSGKGDEENIEPRA